MNNTVSVIIPTKNSSKTLADCLESVKKQTYDNLELIIVDNFSTDSTLDIAKKYTQKIFIIGPERSIQRNHGVNMSIGDYILIIDSDMKLSPEVVKDCVDKIKSSKKLSGIIIPEESFGDGFWAQCKKLERSFYVNVPYMEAARFFRKKDYLKIGGYNADMISGEDWDLSQRIESLGSLGRIDSYIFHNEGQISLYRLIKKKFYYAEKFVQYSKVNKSSKKTVQQISILKRYKLFLSNPAKLFKKPIIGVGMLFMKTCEFGFGGIGYLKAKIQSKW